MTTVKQAPSATLTQSDLEQVERIIYRSGDDIAVSVARGLERLEERLDGAESRLYSRFADLEDRFDDLKEPA